MYTARIFQTLKNNFVLGFNASRALVHKSYNITYHTCYMYKTMCSLYYTYLHAQNKYLIDFKNKCEK